VIRGNVIVNNERVSYHQLVEFDNDSEQVSIKAETDAVILFGHALPLNEPVVAQGPFVMNTEEEIVAAYQDYRDGKFGQWA
jgi:redox-sensitive bicupin YhaK (pirin superfamily)